MYEGLCDACCDDLAVGVWSRGRVHNLLGSASSPGFGLFGEVISSGEASDMTCLRAQRLVISWTQVWAIEKHLRVIERCGVRLRLVSFVNALRGGKAIFRDVDLKFSASRAGLERSKGLSNILMGKAEFDLGHSHKMMVV